VWLPSTLQNMVWAVAIVMKFGTQMKMLDPTATPFLPSPACALDADLTNICLVNLCGQHIHGQLVQLRMFADTQHMHSTHLIPGALVFPTAPCSY
jgi:hypothetical protein